MTHTFEISDLAIAFFVGVITCMVVMALILTYRDWIAEKDEKEKERERISQRVDSLGTHQLNMHQRLKDIERKLKITHNWKI